MEATLNRERMTGQEPGAKKKGICGSTLKLIAIAAMLIDHISATVLTRMLIVNGMGNVTSQAQQEQWLRENAGLYGCMVVMRLIGRLGFPIFCFLLVEGFQKTGNVKKYALRLGLFALLSEIPFDLACHGKVLEFDYQNVFFTLFLGFLLMWAADTIEKGEFPKWFRNCLAVGGVVMLTVELTGVIYSILCSVMQYQSGTLPETYVIVMIGAICAAVISLIVSFVRRRKGEGSVWKTLGYIAAVLLAMYAANLLRTDYSGMGVLTIAVMYFLRKHKVKSMLGGCIVLSLMSLIELPAFLTLIPVKLYNGERGLKLKYFFYAFYPVHFFLLWVICALMGMGGISVV